MREIIITKDESGQRLDRYIRKLLGKANLSFIYKQIRKKNIVVNDLKVSEKYILNEEDVVKIYFSEETINKFKSEKKKIINNIKLDIIYEDDNILIINKPSGILSHSTKDDYKEKNIVDGLKNYLMEKGDFVPSRNSTFTPSIANRLDRNTSGLLIGAKTYNAIQELNKAQRKNAIKKYYYTIVAGSVGGSSTETANIQKVKSHENLVEVSNKESDENKEIITTYRSIIKGKKISLLEIDLETGRTHQIRAHMAFLKMPIIGDRKYGNLKINKYYKSKYNIENQILQCYKLKFSQLEGDLEYLNDKEFSIEENEIIKKIIKGEIHESK